MGNLSNTVAMIYWIFYTIALLVLYHKVFSVYYFNLKQGLLKELVTSAITGLILTAMSLYYWIIGIIVIMCLALMCVAKIQSPTGKKIIMVIAIIASIMVAIVGHQLRKQNADNSDDDTDYDEYEYDYDYEVPDKTDDEYGGNDDFGTDYESKDDYKDVAYEDDNTDRSYDDYNDETYAYDDEDFKFEDSSSGEEYGDQENDPLDFVFPYSDSMYLEVSDLQGLSAEECRIARNEIYARHGRIFQDIDLQTYFEQFDWYEGLYTADEFDESVLNKYEKANRDLIVKYESEMGFW